MNPILHAARVWSAPEHPVKLYRPPKKKVQIPCDRYSLGALVGTSRSSRHHLPPLPHRLNIRVERVGLCADDYQQGPCIRRRLIHYAARTLAATPRLRQDDNWRLIALNPQSLKLSRAVNFLPTNAHTDSSSLTLLFPVSPIFSLFPFFLPGSLLCFL